jgi:uncharacterized membrane-anchored protein
MTLTATELEAALDGLNADSLDHLGCVLRERAKLRRVFLTKDEARAAVLTAPLSPAWERSQLSDVGRVRTAARLLVQRGYHPEQVVDSMTTVAFEEVGHRGIAEEAVASGLADGMAAREGISGAY